MTNLHKHGNNGRLHKNQYHVYSKIYNQQKIETICYYYYHHHHHYKCCSDILQSLAINMSETVHVVIVNTDNKVCSAFVKAKSL